MIMYYSFLVLLACLSSCKAIHLAIVRTFSLNDAKQLPGSFDVWDAHPPCIGGTTTNVSEPTTSSSSVDLFLAFSQSLESSPTAEAAVEKVKRSFLKTNGWGDCIRKLVVFGTGIEPERDLYNPEEQSTNHLWVNGPNRQFERAVRKIQHHPSVLYDVMYLMEKDSIPVKDYWLDILLEEIENQPNEFAILGSKYRGDKWDTFYSRLPSSLVHHLNGNALYNLTHPLFNEIMEQLKKEATTTANSIAYDYRMSQILEEIQSGIMPSLRSYSSVRPASKLPNHLIEFGRSFNLSSIFRETQVISNYASTNMVSDYLNEHEAIIHGALLWDSWDQKKCGGITLVVSDWDEAHFSVLLARLEHSRHPFNKVIIVLPERVNVPEEHRRHNKKNETNQKDVSIEFIHREKDDFLDLCSTPVESTWFMMTDSYHQVRRNLQVMTSEVVINQGEEDEIRYAKPVVSFSKATNETCFQFEQCNKELKLSSFLLPSYSIHHYHVYQNQDFVFHTETRNEYCRELQNYFDNSTPPSATSYIAYLRETRRVNELYIHSDRNIFGSRQPFLALPTMELPPTMKIHRRRFLMSNPTNESNINNCNSHETDVKCTDAGCEWRQEFESCRGFASRPNLVSTTENNSPPKQKTRTIWATVGFLAFGMVIIVLGYIGLAIGERGGAEDSVSNLTIGAVPDVCEEDQIAHDLEEGNDANESSCSGNNNDDNVADGGVDDDANLADDDDGGDEEHSFNSFETISLIDFVPVAPEEGE